MDLENITINNKEFRKILETNKKSQLVVMSIDDDIPKEIHQNSDQFIRVEKGTIDVFLWKGKKYEKYTLMDGYSITIPMGTYHYVRKTYLSDPPAKIYTIYSPPVH